MLRDINTVELFSTADSRFVVFSDAHRGEGYKCLDNLPNSG